MKKTVLYFSIISAVAFMLQLIWEYTQCGLFYTIDNLTGHTRLMLSATFGDMMMSVVLYLLLSFVNKDFAWIRKKWHRYDYVIMILYSLFLSFYFEIDALHTGRWQYNADAMPLFLDTPIGLIPVLQLLILLPLIFLISKKIIKATIKTRLNRPEKVKVKRS